MMKLDEYLTEYLMPIYPTELERRRRDFFLFFINVLPFGAEGMKLTTSDLGKNVIDKIPKNKIYVFVYNELNEEVPYFSCSQESL